MSQSKQFKNIAHSTQSIPLILASTSVFRQKLLTDAGIRFQAMAPQNDEKSIGGLPPKILAAKRAEFKALDVARLAPPASLVLGADQVLGFRGQPFDKPVSRDEAIEKLRLLQGQTHTLHSAFCIVKVHPSASMETLYESVVDIPMTMRTLSDREIEDYVATEEWKGCVGAYRIEGQGQKLFLNIPEDLSAIIGLPMRELNSVLDQIHHQNSGT